MKKLKETQKNFIAILVVIFILFISAKISNYVIDNKPINNKRNTILFRH